MRDDCVKRLCTSVRRLDLFVPFCIYVKRPRPSHYSRFTFCIFVIALWNCSVLRPLITSVLPFAFLWLLSAFCLTTPLRGPLIIRVTRPSYYLFSSYCDYSLFCTRASLVKMKRLRHFLSYRNIVRENRLPSYLAKLCKCGVAIHIET